MVRSILQMQVGYCKQNQLMQKEAALKTSGPVLVYFASLCCPVSFLCFSLPWTCALSSLKPLSVSHQNSRAAAVTGRTSLLRPVHQSWISSGVRNLFCTADWSWVPEHSPSWPVGGRECWAQSFFFLLDTVPEQNATGNIMISIAGISLWN